MKANALPLLLRTERENELVYAVVTTQKCISFAMAAAHTMRAPSWQSSELFFREKLIRRPLFLSVRHANAWERIWIGKKPHTSRLMWTVCHCKLSIWLSLECRSSWKEKLRFICIYPLNCKFTRFFIEMKSSKFFIEISNFQPVMKCQNFQQEHRILCSRGVVAYLNNNPFQLIFILIDPIFLY